MVIGLHTYDISTYFSFSSFLQAWKYHSLLLLPTIYIGHHMLWTSHQLLLNLLLMQFIISHIPSSQCLFKWLLKPLQSSSIFLSVSFPFQLSKHMFCRPSYTVSHLVPYHRSFSLQIPFVPLDHFLLKCCYHFLFQIPSDASQTHDPWVDQAH